jgi:hypothetical protein
MSAPVQDALGGIVPLAEAVGAKPIADTKTKSKAKGGVAADFNQLQLFIRHAARIDVAAQGPGISGMPPPRQVPHNSTTA